MHYCLEIIMPPVYNIKRAVTQILEPFKEGGLDEDGDRNSNSFWDWWVIGGRWASHKLRAQLDPGKLKDFEKELIALEIGVNSFQAGKEEIVDSR